MSSAHARTVTESQRLRIRLPPSPPLALGPGLSLHPSVAHRAGFLGSEADSWATGWGWCGQGCAAANPWPHLTCWLAQQPENLPATEGPYFLARLWSSKHRHFGHLGSHGWDAPVVLTGQDCCAPTWAPDSGLPRTGHVPRSSVTRCFRWPDAHLRLGNFHSPRQ